MKNPKKCTTCCWDSTGEAHRCGFCCKCRHPFISNRMPNTVKFNPKLIPVMDVPLLLSASAAMCAMLSFQEGRNKRFNKYSAKFLANKDKKDIGNIKPYQANVKKDGFQDIQTT